MFSSRYEAAKLVEDEQDAEIEEAERRQKASLDAAHEKAAGKTLGKRKEQAGEWCESDSGLLWHPADSSTLDDSGDGLAALQACRQEAAAMAGNPIGGCSQEDDENYTKGTHRFYCIDYVISYHNNLLLLFQSLWLCLPLNLTSY